MIKTNKGFSFVELLTVIIIIGILAGFLYLLMGSSDDKAKREACYGNRVSIILALDTYRFSSGLSKENYTLQNFINDKYKDTISNNEATCPSGGVYSAGEENGKEIVICSIHSVTPGGGPSGNVIPGTDLFGGDGNTALDDWEETIIGEHSISFNIGQKFLYEGKYYVATETLSNIYYLTDHDPEMNTSKWWTTKANGGLVQFTGVSKNWDEIETGYRFYRGDILYYNGDYYVCKAQGYTGYFDVIKGQYWSNTPDLSGSEWAWYKLSS